MESNYNVDCKDAFGTKCVKCAFESMSSMKPEFFESDMRMILFPIQGCDTDLR